MGKGINITSKEHSKMHELRRQGLTIELIAQRFGLSERVVRKHLAKPEAMEPHNAT